MTIKKPKVLISLYLRRGPQYSAGGWLAYQIGFSVADGARSFISRGDEVAYAERVSDRLVEKGIKVNADDIWELDQRCDTAPMDDRIELFCDWCAEHGIDVQ